MVQELLLLDDWVHDAQMFVQMGNPVSIILGARTEPARRQRPPPSLHLPQREPGVLQRRAQSWKSSF